MTFEEWWNDAGWHTDFEDDLHEVWAAAQAAERERIKQIVRDVTDGRSNCNRLLERIEE